MSEQNCTDLLDLTSHKQCREYFEENIFLGYLDQLNPDQIDIFLDYIISLFEFAKLQRFSCAKISCLIDLSQHLFEETIANMLSFDKSFELFKQFLLRHALHRPPHSIELFNLKEVKCITSYFMDTYFRHFLLYKKAFIPVTSNDVET